MRTARLLCALLAVAGCKGGGGRDAGVDDNDDGWLRGGWRSVYTVEGNHDWLLFKPPGEVALMGKNTYRGTYLVRGRRVGVMLPHSSGWTSDVTFEAADDRQTLTARSGAQETSYVFEHRSDTSELDTLLSGTKKKNERGQREDLRWIAGTWKQDGGDRWLLFNPPLDVVELVGRPASVARRGMLSVHGRFISVVFPDGEAHLEAPEDLASLVSDTQPPQTYRRGAPP